MSININKYRLNSAMTVAWGDILGDISEQTDLTEKLADYPTKEGFKTVNGNSLIGEGNIQIGDGVSMDEVDKEIDIKLTGYAKTDAIPSKTSQLTNDSGFLTEHQSLTGYATESWVEGKGYLTEHQSLEGYAKTTDIPTKTSQLTNDSGFLTEHQSLEGYATESWVEGKGYLTEHQSLTGYATESWVEGKGYLTEHQSLTGYATESWVEGKNYLTAVPDTYATKSYVDEKIGELETITNEILA